MNPYAHDLYEALSMIREDPDPENKKRDYYTVVEDLLDNLLQLLSRLLFERETMDGERKRCLAILKVSNPPKPTSSNCLAYLKSKQLNSCFFYFALWCCSNSGVFRLFNPSYFLLISCTSKLSNLTYLTFSARSRFYRPTSESDDPKVDV